MAESERDLPLIQELTASEGQLGPTLRAVYDSSDGRSVEFLRSLEGFSKRMDSEIERTCSKYYQSFIDSIDQLMHVRRDALDLKDLVQDAHKAMTETGSTLTKSCDELVEARAVQLNILVAIESLTACLPVIRLYVKARQQLTARRFYPTLKTLQDLELNHLPSVSQYTFAQRMQETIPQLRQSVKQASFAELQNFLADIRARCGDIGKAAMKQTEKGQALEVEQSSNSRQSMDSTASAQADFSPIYRCLHIYDVLGVRSECEHYYKEERKKQAQLVLEPVSYMSSLEDYRVYLHKVAGFFLVEETVLTTTSNLLKRPWVDELWEGALVKISDVFDKQLAKCSTPTMIYEVKQLVVLFNQTLQSYGYNVTRLFDILLQVRDCYTTVLLSEYADNFRSIFRQENYTPLTVQNEEDYQAVRAKFPYESRILQEAQFPKSFPFSAVVPEVYGQVRAFIDHCVKFVEDLDLSHTEVDEMVRKAANKLLSQTLSGIMSMLVRTQHLGLPQLTQMSVNTTELEKACDHLETYISQITHSLEDDVHITRLHGASAFKDARTAAEDQIFKVLQNQIDQFIELAEYDWTPAAASEDSSEFIFDLLAYLTTIFASLTNMPVDVARAAYFSTCKYIAQALIQQITSEEVKRINLNGIRNFSLDIETCEQYADNCPLVATDDDLFRGVFNNLRQLVDLFMRWDWATFLDRSGRAGAYNQVKLHVVLSVLEKFDDSARKGVFGFKSADDRSKSKEVDGLVKRLRAMMGGGAPGAPEPP